MKLDAFGRKSLKHAFINLFGPAYWRSRALRHPGFWSLSPTEESSWPQCTQDGAGRFNLLPLPLSSFLRTVGKAITSLAWLSPSPLRLHYKTKKVLYLSSSTHTQFSLSFFLFFSLPPPDSSQISKLMYKLILWCLLALKFYCTLEKFPSPSHLEPFSEIMFQHLYLSFNPLEHLCSFSPGWFLKMECAYSDILSSCSEKCCRIRHKVT